MCHCKNSSTQRDYEVSAEDYAEAREIFAKRISNNFSGENAYWYGKHQSDSSNKKRSAKESGEGNHMYGKHHSEETKHIISEKNKGKNTGANHHNARKVRCINTGEVFPTAQSAADFYKLKNRSSITMNCSGYTDSAGKDPVTKQKLHWEYVE